MSNLAYTLQCCSIDSIHHRGNPKWDQVQKFPHVGKFMHLIHRVFDGSGYFTLPSSVHCPVHLHNRPAPSVYTAFLLMPYQLRFEPATMVSQLL